MDTRRGFLTFLGSLPFLSFLKVDPEKLYEGMIVADDPVLETPDRLQAIHWTLLPGATWEFDKSDFGYRYDFEFEEWEFKVWVRKSKEHAILLTQFGLWDQLHELDRLDVPFKVTEIFKRCGLEFHFTRGWIFKKIEEE